MTPDLVVLGNLIVDDIVLPDGRTRMGEPGGAMLYASLGARLWNVHVGIVSPCGADYPRETLDRLEKRGVDLGGLRRLEGPGLRTWLLYEPRARRVVHHLDAPRHIEASPRPDDVPPSYAGARAFHLSPMPLESQRPLVASLAARRGARLSLDPHEPVREDNLDLWREVLDQIDVFFLSDEELQLTGAAADPVAALRRLAGGRLETIVLKRGARGGLHFDVRSGATIEWDPEVIERVDATGAGDAFAGGYLAGRIEGEDARESIEQGVVSASFALEGWGAEGLLNATPAAARLRQQDWYAERAGG
jgi:sugar/nucleoside kinase (ribokinase family)